MIGQLLGGRYRVLRILGAGSFGQTFLAEDTHRPETPKCVLKHLKPTVNDASFLPVARELFAKEAAVLEKLGHHDQIPRLLAYFEQAQEFYLVQEFIEGQVLSVAFKNGQRWSEEQVVQLLQDVLEILEFVHQCGVIHRDLKPDNLIRRKADGRFVLIDFGAVKQIQLSLDGRWSASDRAVSSTIAIGTPGYMPAEQSQGRPRPNSDVYALGMIGIQALTGLLPTQLQSDDAGELDWQKQAQVSVGLALVLHKMVRYSFQDRYQTATEALIALQQFHQSPRLWGRVAKFLQTPVQDLLTKRNPPSLPDTSEFLPSPSPFSPEPRSFLAEASIDLHSTSSYGHSASSKEPRSHVFISYRNLEPESSLAQDFYQALVTAGYEPFMSGQSHLQGQGWAQRMNEALKACDYYLLLLSPHSANSEMVLEEIRTVKQLQGTRTIPKPVILPIRLSLPLSLPLNYELRGYLHRIQQRFWHSSADTESLIQDLLALLTQGSQASASLSETGTPSGALSITPPLRSAEDLPLPVADPELPEGQMSLASAFYVERPPTETRCYETILQPGALIRIKAPRQMGQTSLMARILHQATQQGYHSVPLSLQLADNRVFKDLDMFLRWLCASLGRRLQIPNQMDQYWDDIFGSKYNCTAYFEEYLLPAIATPLALGLDEVDRIFAYPDIASDFFGLLRAWHEEAKNREIWKKLRLVVVHSTEVYIPLNINQSPFNVGLPIELPEFTPDQVAALAQLHELQWSDRDIQNLMAMVGGHPYLVRLALYQVARQDTTLERLLREAPTEMGLYRDHLHGHLWNLQRHPELAAAFQQVLQASDAVQLESVSLFKLHSLGLIRLEGNRAKLRCDLYHQYFQAQLGVLNHSTHSSNVSQWS
jgi:serine/threonine-protein kinase